MSKAERDFMRFGVEEGLKTSSWSTKGVQERRRDEFKVRCVAEAGNDIPEEESSGLWCEQKCPLTGVVVGRKETAKGNRMTRGLDFPCAEKMALQPRQTHTFVYRLPI